MSRRANRFTDQFPTVAKACEHLPPDTLLDGEIIALDNTGRISFNLLQHHRSQAQAILFYAFDVIIDRGRRLIHVPLGTRRELLSDIAADLKRHTPLISLSDTLDTTPAELIPLVKEFGFEGHRRQAQRLLLRDRQAIRRLGKYKVNEAQAFVIGGYTPDNPLDALIVGYYESDKLIFASKVRNGFVPRMRREVWSQLKDLETSRCPFFNLPEKKRTQWALTREEMKNCVWLKPELVAQVEYTEFTPDGHLRHSKFCGLRQDKNPRAVQPAARYSTTDPPL